MDYLRAIEAMIPGARGQVLSALTRNTSPQTVRQVSLSAGVSWSQTAQVIDDLAGLGIVERRPTPGAILVRLAPDNVAAGAIQAITDLRTPAIDALRHEADPITPAPLSLTVFGSFARGEARRDSDVDVVAVHDPAAAPGGAEEDLWTETIGRWVGAARSITGNAVHLIDLKVSELRPAPRKAPTWLRDASKDGIVIAGRPLRDLMDSQGRRRAARG
ncbi:MAG: nucleotidyltransferase domain-containing protein [Acidimicrobiales bacterium]